MTAIDLQSLQAKGLIVNYPLSFLVEILLGVENTTLSSCHGDIGGPYACLNSDMKTYTLHGIVSWGPKSCNASEFFTVVSRVTKFRAWIQQHTGIGGGGGLELVT